MGGEESIVFQQQKFWGWRARSQWAPQWSLELHWNHQHCGWWKCRSIDGDINIKRGKGILPLYSILPNFIKEACWKLGVFFREASSLQKSFNKYWIQLRSTESVNNRKTYFEKWFIPISANIMICNDRWPSYYIFNIWCSLSLMYAIC